MHPAVPQETNADPVTVRQVPDMHSGEPTNRIIRLLHLTKIFASKVKTIRAVDDVTFDVGRGEIFGLLGPNGAGKSTLIRMLTTLLKPTSGTAFLDEYELGRDPEKIRTIIGVCSQNSTLDLELSAYDNLEFYGALVNVDAHILDARIWELLEMTGLSDLARARVGTFSGGMRRKLEIVRAFIHHPLILFLDEPTIGLDPEARREVWQQIAQLNKEQTTIILTTHYMDEAEKLCDRIAFVDKGKLVALDTLENLKRLLPEGDLIEIGFEQIDEGVLSAIRQNELVNSVEVKEGRLVITAKNGSRVLPGIVAVFEASTSPMTSISIRSPSLEDVFIHLTGKRLDDGKTPDTKPSRGGHPP
jgi:ABC-2 type transport system ATP-binding protein